MRNTKNYPFCGMLAVLILSLILAACQGKAETDGETVEINTSAEGNLLHLTGTGHTYTIIRNKDLDKSAVSACKELNQYLGDDLKLTADETKEGEASVFGEYEILLGMTNRPESIALAEGLGLYDYRIAVQEEKLVIVGGSDDALINAIAYLLRNDVLADGTISRDCNVYFDGADNRDEYIANPDLFLCNWVLDFEVPEWMTDFEEKIAAFADADGRMMSSIHRGDYMHYPENSIEAIISAVKMGADNIEMDLRLTSDGVVVLMHDETLSRTTDWKTKAGKNGLPTSEKICDWTFEELQNLRLLSPSDKVTDYLIPTFKEALQVCNERTTIRLDKPEVWDWDTDVYPLIQETGAWRTCILNYHFSLEKQKRIMDTIKVDSGKEVLAYYRLKHNERENWASLVESLTERGYNSIIRWDGFKISQSKRYIEEAESNLNQIKDEVRIYVDAQLIEGGNETPESWDYLYENGVDFILVDNGLKIQQYIAENFEATEY